MTPQPPINFLNIHYLFTNEMIRVTLHTEDIHRHKYFILLKKAILSIKD